MSSLGSLGRVRERVLLVDLDGVLAAEGPVADEVYRAHRDAAAVLADVPSSTRVEIVTHRSRGEARRLAAALGLPRVRLHGWENLLRLALGVDGFGRLMRRGVRKDTVLSWLAVRRVRPEDVAVIDDRADVLEGFVERGVGLALHAPAARWEAGRLRTFDLEATVARVARWCDEPAVLALGVEPLEAIELDAPWAPTGVVVPRDAGARGALRRLLRWGRRWLAG